MFDNGLEVVNGSVFRKPSIAPKTIVSPVHLPTRHFPVVLRSVKTKFKHAECFDWRAMASYGLFCHGYHICQRRSFSLKCFAALFTLS